MLLLFCVITVSINVLQTSVPFLYLQKTENRWFSDVISEYKSVLSVHLLTKSRQKEHFSLMT